MTIDERLKATLASGAHQLTVQHTASNFALYASRGREVVGSGVGATLDAAITSLEADMTRSRRGPHVGGE